MDNFLVEGEVTKVWWDRALRKHNITVESLTLGDKKIQASIVYDGYSNIKRYDLISAVCRKVKRMTALGETRENVVVSARVKIAGNSSVVRFCIKNNLPTSKSWGYVGDILARLENEGSKLGFKSVAAFLAEASMFYVEKCYKMECLDFVFKDDEEADKVLKAWHNEYNMRRLLVLGFTRSGILKNPLSATALWETCRSNPFSLVMCDMPLVENIIARMWKKDVVPGILNDYLAGDTRLDVAGCKSMHTIGNYVWNRLCQGETWTDVDRLDRQFIDELFRKHNPLDYMMVWEHSLNRVTLSFVDDEVKTIVKHVNRLLNDGVPSGVDEDYLKEIIEEGFICGEQLSALFGSLNSGISIITGPAGSGKSTLIRYLFKCLEKKERRFMTTSFMGKAASRINEVTKGQSAASTIHYALCRRDIIDEFEGTLIVDEATTLSQSLFARLLSSFGNKIQQLILIGDINQLNPIDYGSPFEDLFRLKKIPIYTLTKCHRQESGGGNGILLNSRAIIESRGFVRFTESEDFSIIDGGTDVVHAMADAFSKNGESMKDKVKVITPYNQCVEQVNRIFQDKYNVGKEPFVDVCGKRWFVGDVVMSRKNNGTIFNGMEGIIESIDRSQSPPVASIKLGESETIEVKFPLTKHQAETYEEDDYNPNKKKELTMKDFDVSYAVTMDKSQGSEWKVVLVYVPDNVGGGVFTSFLNKRRLYVAITRAKSACWCIGKVSTFESMAAKDVVFRKGCLYHRLQESLPDYIMDEVYDTPKAPVEQSVPEFEYYIPDDEY